jgi:hypothetical protein
MKSPRKKSNSVSKREYRAAIDKQNELRAALQGLMIAAEAIEHITDDSAYETVEAAAIGMRLAAKQASVALGGEDWNSWGEWLVADGVDAFPHLDPEFRPKVVWRNNLFEVWLRVQHMHDDSDLPAVAELSIKRHDRLPIDYNHWRTLQRIKDELLGAEFDAAALHPCADRLIDSANQYRIYAMPRGMRLPFGDNSRVVASVGVGKAVQRPFEPGQTPEGDMAADPATMEEAEQFIKEVCSAE